MGMDALHSLDNKKIALIASAISYVVYNVLFIAAQIWPAIATLILGVYYVAIFLGLRTKNKSLLIMGTVIQAVATFVFFGFFVFFMVEIFVAQSFVYKELVYLKNLGEDKREKAARACSIVMMVDSLVTGFIHFFALYYCFEACKTQSLTSSTDSPIAAMAIHTELEYPPTIEIPRLRTTSWGEIVGLAPRRGKLGDSFDRHRSMPPPRQGY